MLQSKRAYFALDSLEVVPNACICLCYEIPWKSRKNDEFLYSHNMFVLRRAIIKKCLKMSHVTYDYVTWTYLCAHTHAMFSLIFCMQCASLIEFDRSTINFVICYTLCWCHPNQFFSEPNQFFWEPNHSWKCMNKMGWQLQVDIDPYSFHEVHDY